jgi:hypothetical protein
MSGADRVSPAEQLAWSERCKDGLADNPEPIEGDEGEGEGEDEEEEEEDEEEELRRATS